MYKFIVLAVVLAVFTAGCVNFQYKGEAFAPTEQVNIYEDAKKIPDKKYLVMGLCVASGRYNDVTREKMYLRLQAEAEKKGADAVLIDSYQIVPTGVSEETLLGQDSVSLWSEGSVTNSGWNQLYSDFDSYYGSIGKEDKKGVPQSYMRIVRASFIKYDKNLPKDFDVAAFRDKCKKYSKTIAKFKQPTTFKKPPEEVKKKGAEVINFRDMN
ncbi:MAG: hypothetical protein PHV59_02010 [Victivallales bacterium]|nr:hypothetical protein [Victivallales bacterium]